MAFLVSKKINPRRWFVEEETSCPMTKKKLMLANGDSFFVFYICLKRVKTALFGGSARSYFCSSQERLHKTSNWLEALMQYN